jgi:hypothetical protein
MNGGHSSPMLRHVKSEERLNDNVSSLASSPGGNGPSLPVTSSMTSLKFNGLMPDVDCWSQEDDELTLQYPGVLRNFPRDRDTISMMSADSTDSSRGYLNGHETVFVAAGDIRRRLSESLKGENKSRKNLKRDPDDPSAAVLKEPWEAKVCSIFRSLFSLSNCHKLEYVV